MDETSKEDILWNEDLASQEHGENEDQSPSDVGDDHQRGWRVQNIFLFHILLIFIMSLCNVVQINDYVLCNGH